MVKFNISTDSTSDIFVPEMKQANVSCIPLAYIIDGVPHYDTYENDAQVDEFYKVIASGKMPTTSMLNSEEHAEYFNKLLLEKKTDIVHFSLSSGLSGTADNAKMAAKEINETSQFKVYVIDSIAATQGIALMIDRCVKMRDSGKTGKEAFEYFEELKHKIHHWVIVDDLHHLKRGGRLSGASAFLGSILKLKPIIKVSTDGKLVVASKAIGMKKAVRALMDAVKTYGENISEQTVYIANTTDKELESTISQTLIEEFGCKVHSRRIGPVIGSHTGCGTLAIMFVGKVRKD